MMGKDIKVIVAAHKKYEMPKDKIRLVQKERRI